MRWKIVAAICGLISLACCGSASAQTAMAQTVASCGTPPSTRNAGIPYPLLMDTNGNLCTGAGSVTGTVTANQGTQGSAGSAWYVQPGTGATFPLPTTPTVANGNGVIPSPSSESAAGLSKAQCSALCSNQIVKASAGNLYAFNVSADSTLSGAAWWILVFDATSLPANGAVTPAKCYAETANTTGDSKGWGITPVAFGTGIVIGVSTTGCFTLTASTHAFIAGDFK